MSPSRENVERSRVAYSGLCLLHTTLWHGSCYAEPSGADRGTGSTSRRRPRPGHGATRDRGCTVVRVQGTGRPSRVPRRYLAQAEHGDTGNQVRQPRLIRRHRLLHCAGDVIVCSSVDGAQNTWKHLKTPVYCLVPQN